MPTPSERAMAALTEWYDTLPKHAASGGGPARGTVATALWVLERLRDDFNLDLDSHRAAGGAQIKGVSPANLAAVLVRFGETRAFLKEGGRSNRGAPGAVRGMLRALAGADLGRLNPEDRNGILDSLQEFLVDKVRDYHLQQCLKPVYDPAQSTRQFIQGVLRKADESQKRGPVAQHLVGAKLQLRFPEVGIRNETYSAADDPTGQPGDFCIGDTAFHVTVAPSQGHYEKCKRNLQEGRRVFLLVPDDRIIGARQNVEQEAPGRIAVESIESFVAQNIEELSGFTTDRFTGDLCCYSRRA